MSTSIVSIILIIIITIIWYKIDFIYNEISQIKSIYQINYGLLMQERNMPYTQAEAQPKMRAQGAAHMPYISHSQAYREIKSDNRKTFFEY